MKNFVSRRRCVVWILAVVMLAPFVYSRAGNGGDDGDMVELWKMALAACCDRNPGKDYDTLDAAGNDEPTGIWSDGTTMWVADDAEGWVDGLENNDRIYAYVLATRARDPGKDFNTLNAAGNDDPEGIWSDGTTMWVADQSEEKLYAYDMTTRERVREKDFNTLDAAGNDEPTGIWSDGRTMWVADDADETIYAYNMPQPNRAPPGAPTDFNGDGRTDFADFFLFVDAFGSTDPRYDLDGNGVVDFADFFKFVDAFGS